MNYNRTVKNDSAVTVRVMCAVVFVVFTFLWLYFFQADLLSVAQHVFSGGRTSYNRLTGTLLITLVLMLLQLGVFWLVPLRKFFHALTYFPSFLCLAMLTSAGERADCQFSLGRWLWLAPLLLVLWGGLVWVARSLQLYEARHATGLFSRCMWVNMLTMAFMMTVVAMSANTNAVFHFRTHAESALLSRDYDEALRVGNSSHETDASLTMVRMYALARKGQLGDRLFHYPVYPSSVAILPTATGARMLMYPADSVYRFLGAVPRRPMQPHEYLAAIERSGQAKAPAHDYLLCSLLIDKDLDSFARQIGRYYTVNDSLPRHYREALVLYTHLRSNPHIVYHDPVLDVDYDDLQTLKADYKDYDERKGKVLEHYRNSYWYYYEFIKPINHKQQQEKK